MYRPVLSDEVGDRALLTQRRAPSSLCCEKVLRVSALSFALIACCFLGVQRVAQGSAQSSASFLSQTSLKKGAGQLFLDGLSIGVQNAVNESFSLGSTLANADTWKGIGNGIPSDAKVSVPFGGNFSLGSAIADANDANPFGGNFTVDTNILGSPFGGNITLGSLASGPFSGTIQWNLSRDANAVNPFSGNFSLGDSIAGAEAEGQGLLNKAGSVVQSVHPDFWPTYIDENKEYYDNDTVIAGSWHLASCDSDHLYKCHNHAAPAVSACCCRAGFAYVSDNAGKPLVKDAAVGAATGAAHGAIITGAMLGGDVGATTAAGAATGAASGALAALVEYLFEGGKCVRKDLLSAAVRAHLS